MIKFSPIIKLLRKCKTFPTSNGMTYVELIVVLGIFSVLSSIAIFNYSSFQANIDIKNLANDIALQIVQAQKSALSGALPVLGGYDSTWKPSYGVYFNSSTAIDSIDPGNISLNKKFIYFADLGTSDFPQNNLFDGSSCTGECLNAISITKNNIIYSLGVFYQNGSAATLNDLTITFARPSSSPVLFSGSGALTGVSYVQITIASPDGKMSAINLSSSGRVQIGSPDVMPSGLLPPGGGGILE